MTLGTAESLYFYFTDDAIEVQKDEVIFPLVLTRGAGETTALRAGRNRRGGE